MIKMVVFDMAGTTIDEGNIVYKTLMKCINNAGFNMSLELVLAIGAGKEKRQAIKDIIATEQAAGNDLLVNSIYEIFVGELAVAYNSFDIKPQEGAMELFGALRSKGILVVLNTGYNGTTARAILQQVHWRVGIEIDGLVTASDVQHNRPNPDMILLAMEKFGVTDAGEVAKVGDSAIDIEEGRNAGCGLTVGITTGAHTQAQLLIANPSHIIQHLNELLPLL